MRSLLESAPKIFYSRYFVSIRDSPEEIRQAIRLKHNFHDLSEGQSSEMTHIFRPTQHAKHKSFMAIRLLDPLSQQPILQFISPHSSKINRRASISLDMRQDHRHPKIDKFVVLRDDAVDDPFLVHFDDLTVPFVGSHEHSHSYLLRVVFYGRADYVEEVKKIFRFLFLVL